MLFSYLESLFDLLAAHSLIKLKFFIKYFS